ncbi:MAG TPA: 16S rRNA (guanine(527)-N(7))-methyltransferase RsmG [Chloroflexi bacterium]|nr:16S rRNA (guanine(527)-N(7))-methyltransferase RsmG [Anaerolineaceae bacterium]HHX07862.1 16S rRNA (guanine(527)-N(7))-methyltransferase RsmG [Chloroflexota bacterium]
MKKWIEIVKESFSIELTPDQVAAFDLFERELLEWNQKISLTAIREPEMIELKHFADSLSCLLAIDPSNPPKSIIDIGTGAGLPGIPLKIIFPEARLTLVESVKKKAAFCQHMVDQLELKDVIVSSARAEEVGQDPLHREKYDLALARAVAAMPTLVEYLLPLTAIGGMVIMQKSASAREEAEASRNAIRLFGGKLREIIPVNIPGIEDERYLVVLDKIKATRDEFPRRVGVPAKLPIKN